MTNVLIVGEKSFVGCAVSRWLLEKHPGEYYVDTISSRDNKWKSVDFSK